jgi:L,D-transpeptidase catalytic domain
MRRALLLSILIGALLAPAASAQDPAEPRIRAAVLVAGVDVGGLTVAEARLRLREALVPAFREPVVIQAAGKSFHLARRKIRFRFDARATARQALAAGAAIPPAADGTVAPVAVTPVVSYRREPIGAWIRSVKARVTVAPRDATIAYSIRRLKKRHSKPGRTLRTRGINAAVENAFADPAASRVLAPGRRDVPAKVGWEDLPRVYGTVLTIEQRTFKLRLFKRLKLAKTYRVAVGQPAYPTPSGIFSVTSKQVNPVWTAPNSPWAGELAGQSVAGGAANNPLKARWMGLAGGVGIHGTGQPWSIGTRASHGCIRMTVADVVDLYRRVPLGTPVFIR